MINGVQMSLAITESAEIEEDQVEHSEMLLAEAKLLVLGQNWCNAFF